MCPNQKAYTIRLYDHDAVDSLALCISRNRIIITMICYCEKHNQDFYFIYYQLCTMYWQMKKTAWFLENVSRRDQLQFCRILLWPYQACRFPISIKCFVIKGALSLQKCLFWIRKLIFKTFEKTAAEHETETWIRHIKFEVRLWLSAR